MGRRSTGLRWHRRTLKSSARDCQNLPSSANPGSSESSSSRKVSVAIKPLHPSHPKAKPIILAVVNGERGAYHGPKLSKGIHRTVGMFLKELVEEYEPALLATPGFGGESNSSGTQSPAGATKAQKRSSKKTRALGLKSIQPSTSKSLVSPTPGIFLEKLKVSIAVPSVMRRKLSLERLDYSGFSTLDHR